MSTDWALIYPGQVIEYGEMPSPLNPPAGCRFHNRCPESMDVCSKVEPEMIKKGDHQVKCHNARYRRPWSISRTFARSYYIYIYMGIIR